jgi:hypothetical protein
MQNLRLQGPVDGSTSQEQRIGIAMGRTTSKEYYLSGQPLDGQRAEYQVQTIIMQPAQMGGESLSPELK